MKQKNKQHTKQKVYIVLEYMGDICKIEGIYATLNSAMKYVDRASRQVRCQVDTTLHIIEKSVQGTELEDVIDLDHKSDIIKVSFIHSGDK